MKQIIAVAVLAGMTAVGAFGADARVSLDLASAYVYRGVTFNDGLVLQPGLEVTGLPIDIGVWGNIDIDDYDGSLTEGEFSEIDIYFAYAIAVESFDLGAGYTEYTYPGTEAEADREISVSAGLDVLLAPSLGLYYGFDGGIGKQLFVEAAAEHEFVLGEYAGLTLGGTLAYVDPDQGQSGLPYYTLAAGFAYKWFNAALTYVGRIDDDVLPDGEFAYDVDIYGSLGCAWDF